MDVSEARAKIYHWRNERKRVLNIYDKKSLKYYNFKHWNKLSEYEVCSVALTFLITGQVIKGAGRMPGH